MITQSGLGKDRDPWALRKFLAETGRNMADVARAVNTPRHKVCGTVRGVENHRRTLAHLLTLGCPPEALFPLLYRDPETTGPRPNACSTNCARRALRNPRCAYPCAPRTGGPHERRADQGACPPHGRGKGPGRHGVVAHGQLPGVPPQAHALLY